jgi:hypothetical protein
MYKYKYLKYKKKYLNLKNKIGGADPNIIEQRILELNRQRNNEGFIELDENDIEILGKTSEPHNPNKRIILLVTLKTPYINFLGNEVYKLPFYRVSGKYSEGLGGTFQPFFGYHTDSDNIIISKGMNSKLEWLEKFLDIPDEKALTKTEEYIKRKKKRDTFKLWTLPKLTKCMFPIINTKNFENGLLRKIISNQSIFLYNRSLVKLCNEYLKKYSIAISKYFDKYKIDISDELDNIAGDILSKQVNDLISTNSIYGININTIPTLDIENNNFYIYSIEKINEYEQILNKKIAEEKLKQSESNDPKNYRTVPIAYLREFFDYLRASYQLPSNYDIINFFNVYYDETHQNHNEVKEIVRKNVEMIDFYY